MVLFLLCIKGELEGVDTLSLIKDANICFSVRNPLSDYETREKIVFNPCETLEQDESDREPPHHFAVKWEGSKKFSTLVVLDADAVLAMECRGLEPYEFHALGNEFRVVSEGGTVFEEGVDLSEGDWADYDEEHDASVSISDFEAKIIAA
mmetsp:Transcript_28089/g.57544  ORF Transcript_28089/g.57544 Transcript_28089/m.57544 type:complete len:150 (-) Transcript_28089:1767-2216(-)